MQRDYRLYLKDILESIGKIEKYIGAKGFAEFCDDDLLVDGVARNLEVIGEAAKNVPPDIRDKYKDIEWKKVGGFRDILAHAYFGVDLEIVWDIVKNKLPALKKDIRLVLKDDKRSGE